MSFSTSRSVFCCFLLAAFCLPLAAQQSSPVFDAQKKRHVLTAESAQQTIVFQNLLPGETYGLLVPGGESSLAQCMPEVSVLSPNTQVVNYNPVIKLLKFVASAAEMEFRLSYPCTWDAANPPRHFISMMRAGEKKKTVQEALDMAVLEVNGNTADNLVREVFIGGNCFDVTGITFDGQGDQIGEFSNGLTNVGFNTGMIMATGGISVAPGPNDSDGASAGYGNGTADADLQTLTPGALFDMANIEFDFTPTQSPLTFEFVFASEEYCEYVNTQFNDVFGFFISGPGIGGTQNLAVVPGSGMPGTPITINTINHLTNSGFYTHNTPATGDNCGTIPPATGQATLELQYDGFTKKMVAVANVIPCSTYHIKLKIADVGDGVWDSAVFLKAGSFDGGGNASIDWLVNGEPDIDEVTEGCGTVSLLIDRVGSNPNLPLPVSFTITGTATSGADYGPISSTYVIPAGQDQLTIPVNIVNDLIPEGAETVILTLNNPCSCLFPQEILTILDYNPMMPIADTVAICGAGVATVGVTVDGGVGPYSYQWNTGGTDPTITPFVGVPTTYTVTVTDACGRTSTARARVNINQPPVALLLGPGPQICPGQTAVLSINFTGTGPFDITYNFNNDPQPPITGITDDPYAFVIDQPGSYQLTGVVDGDGCVGSGSGTVLVSPSNLDLTGTVSNLLCSTSTNGSINTTVVGGQGPYNYVWQSAVPIPPSTPDPNNLPAGNYLVTVTDGFGCTDNQSFTITSPPAIAPSILGVQGVNCFSPSGGSINLNVTGGTPNYTYLWSNASTAQDPQNLAAGTYTVTITDANSCTRTATATVPSDFTAPTAVTSPPNMITCSAPSVTLDGTGSSSGGNFSYNWTANPGLIVGGANTLNPIVSQAGTYILVVQNITNGCTASASSTVLGNNTPPTALAGPDATLTCAATNVTLDGSGSSSGGNFSYFWTASGGGFILGGEATPNPIVSATGTYTLLVTNTQNGCTATDVATVNQNITPPNASVAAPGLITCTVSQVTLNGSASTPGGISYQWTTSNGFIVSGQNAPIAVVSEAGQYTLTVMNSSNGCTSSQTVTVNQDFSAPIAVATASNDITCVSLQATVSAQASQMAPTDTFVWSTSDGNFVSGTNTLTPLVNAPGTYSIVITNPTSMCTSQASIVVVADNLPPAANAGPPSTLTCAIISTTLGDPLAPISPNLTYAWTASPGNILLGGNTPMPTVDQPGTYNLVVSNSANGCSNTASVIVGQNITPPTAVAGPGGEINCTVPTIQLNGAGSSTGPTYSYQWTSSTGNGIGAGDNTLTPTIIASGTYTLVVTNAANGCTDSASTSVTTNADVPIALATPMGILNCTFQTVPISSTGSTTGATIAYQWGTINGQIVGPANGAQIIAADPGQYTLIVTNTTNNCTATMTVDVQEDIALPIADAGMGNILNCTVPSMTLNGDSSSIGAQFAYSWTAISGGNFVSPTNILNPQVDEAGVYQILVTNITNGCTSVDQVEILADDNDPIVELSQPAELNCLTLQASINSTGSSTGTNFTYQWTGPGLQSSPTDVDALVDQPGNYTLVITNTDNGCTTEETVPVSQDIQTPPADAGPDVLLNCYNPQMQIGGSNNPSGSNYTFNWIDPGGIISGWNTVNPTVAGGGTYIIIVTNTDNGCTNTDPMDVTIDFEAPQANGGPTFQLTCTQTTYTLQAIAPVGPNFTYEWTTNGGSFISATNILNPTVNGAGEYFLLVTNTTNGCTSSPTVQITQAADVPAAAANSAPDLTCAVTQLILDGTGTDYGVGYNVQWTAANGGNILSGGNTLNPVIDAPGTYTITVQNLVNLCEANSSVTVLEDLAQPQIDAGPQQTLTCTILSLDLEGSNLSPGLFTYNWYTPDGNIVSGGNTLNPTIDAIGYYELTATSLQNGCTNVVGVDIIANQTDPVSAIVQPEILTCVVEQIVLDATGSSTGDMLYVWSTNGGNILDQSDPLAVLVNEPGPYTLHITDNVNGCSSSVTVTVPQDIQDPTAVAGTDGLLTCAITSLTLNGSGSSINGNFFYQWTTPNGNILVGANSLSPVISAGGSYDLVVVNNDNGCTDTDQVIVDTDTDDPVVAIATPGVIGCTQPTVLLDGSDSDSGSNIIFEWTTVGGNILGGTTDNTVTVNTSGQYTLNLLNTSNGCSASQTVQVSDNTVLPLAEAGPPFTLTCDVNQAILQGSGSNGSIYSYTWTTQGGNILSGANSQSPVVNQPGTYALLVTNTTTGCTQTDEVQIFVETNVPTDFDYVLANPTCKDNDGLVTFGQVQGGFGPYTYSIDGGQNYSSAIDFAGIAPGTYDLFIQDANGCEFQQPLTVPQAPDPAITTDPSFNIQLGDEQELTAVLAPGYPDSLIQHIVWTPLDGLTFDSTGGITIQDLLNPTAKPLKTTEYTVTIVSTDGCQATDRVLIRVDNRPHIYIPNVFHPSREDGDNDLFMIFADGDQIEKVDKLQVFDRWGDMVFTDKDFQPNDRSHGWNGMFKGTRMNPAVFVYYAEIRLIDGRVLLYKGDVTLVD